MIFHLKKSMFYAAQKVLLYSIKDFFSKCDKIRSFLWIWSHLLEKFLMGNFIFCAVNVITNISSLELTLLP